MFMMFMMMMMMTTTTTTTTTTTIMIMIMMTTTMMIQEKSFKTTGSLKTSPMLYYKTPGNCRQVNNNDCRAMHAAAEEQLSCLPKGCIHCCMALPAASDAGREVRRRGCGLCAAPHRQPGASAAAEA